MDSLASIFSEFDRQVNAAKDARIMKIFIFLGIILIIVAVVEAAIKKNS